jgi:hypothetical protein
MERILIACVLLVTILTIVGIVLIGVIFECLFNFCKSVRG